MPVRRPAHSRGSGGRSIADVWDESAAGGRDGWGCRTPAAPARLWSWHWSPVWSVPPWRAAWARVLRLPSCGVTAWSTVTGSGFYVDDDRLVRGTKSDDGRYRIGPHVAGCLKDDPCRTLPAAVLSGP